LMYNITDNDYIVKENYYFFIIEIKKIKGIN